MQNRSPRSNDDPQGNVCGKVCRSSSPDHKPFEVAPPFDPSQSFTAAAAEPAGAHPEARMSAASPGTGWGADPDAVTVKDLLTDPKDAIARIGAQTKKDLSDPKLWAGIVLGYLGPKAYDAVAPVVGQAARLAMRSATAAAPKLVKYGTTAAGGAVGGWPGAIVGREVGADLGEALQTRMTAAQVPKPTPAARHSKPAWPRVSRCRRHGSWSLQQVPPNERAALPGARPPCRLARRHQPRQP